jgi:hypothetical protein
MPSLASLTALGTVVFTFINMIRFAVAGQVSSAFRQILAWASGVIAALIVARTSLGEGFTFGSRSLSHIGWFSQCLVGLMAASTISVVNEIKKAIDRTDSARVPRPQVPSVRAQLALLRWCKQTVMEPASLAVRCCSEGQGELVERDADPIVHGQIGGERIAAVSQILHERMAGGDGAC